MIAAILRAQWLSMRTFRLSGKSANSVFSSITGLLFYGFWCFVAFGAESFYVNPENRELFPIVLSGVLMVMCLYWQIMPVITASMGASLDLKKLLVYPIPREHLFLVEVMLRLTTCAEMLIVLSGICIGLGRNPETGGAGSVPRLVLACLLFVTFNLLLAAGLKNFFERLLLRRGVKELMMLLFVTVSLLPQFFIRSHIASSTLKNVIPTSVLLPWNAAARILLSLNLLAPLAVLILFLAAAYLFGRWQFAAGLGFDGESTRIRPRENSRDLHWSERLYDLPSRFLSDPLAAIVGKELRSLSRTAPFRLMFVMGCAFGIILWFPQALNGRAGRPNFMSENILTLASAYGILLLGQVTYFNCFGFDRSATQAWFSLPVPIARVIAGKNLAATIFIFLEILTVTLISLAFRFHITPLKVVENICVSSIAAVYLVSFGNITSVRMPRVLNPEKINYGGASKSLNALVIVCFPVVLSPLVLAFWARSVFESELIFFLLLALAAVFGAILYWVAMGSASSLANSRREKMMADLSRGGGPLTIS